MGIEEHLPGGFLLSSVEKLAAHSRKSSLWPAAFGLACCSLEYMVTWGGPQFDMARFAMERYSPSPRQADLLVVPGRLSHKMAPVLRQVYDQMPEPKWVIAMGACASSGGMFNNYAVVQGVDHVIPVDIYVPGCPPRPQALIDAVMKLQEQIKRERLVPSTQDDEQPDWHPDMPSSIRRAGYAPAHKSWSPTKRRAGEQLREDWIRAKQSGAEKQFVLTLPDAQNELAARERERRSLPQPDAPE